MDALKSLPKDFLIAHALKMLLCLLCIITLGAALVLATTICLYLHAYSFWEVILGGSVAWILFLLVIAVVMYHKQTQYRSKRELLLGLFNKQAMATFALHTFNSFFHKKHPPEEQIKE
jgi:F0F1-type ATP synthase assembly protein I